MGIAFVKRYPLIPTAIVCHLSHFTPIVDFKGLIAIVMVVVVVVVIEKKKNWWTRKSPTDG
jgi:hypothetical protein